MHKTFLLSLLYIFIALGAVSSAQDQNNDQVLDDKDIDAWNSGMDSLRYYYGNNIPASAAPLKDLDGNGVIELIDRDNLILWKCKYNYGDFNCDGKVNAADLAILNANWQQTGRKWRTGDANGDGKVDAADLNILGLNWGISYPVIGSCPQC